MYHHSPAPSSGGTALSPLSLIYIKSKRQRENNERLLEAGLRSTATTATTVTSCLRAQPELYRCDSPPPSSSSPHSGTTCGTFLFIYLSATQAKWHSTVGLIRSIAVDAVGHGRNVLASLATPESAASTTNPCYGYRKPPSAAHRTRPYWRYASGSNRSPPPA